MPSSARTGRGAAAASRPVGAASAVATRSAAAGSGRAAALAAAGLAARISATEPTSAAAARCWRPIPGSRGAGRRRVCAPSSTRTEKANVAQPNQPTTASARRKSWPSSRLVSAVPISAEGGQVVGQRVAGEGEQRDRRADQQRHEHDQRAEAGEDLSGPPYGGPTAVRPWLPSFLRCSR